MATAWVERRLAAILAADVVGYSRLVEQDEASTLSVLRELRREVIDPLLAEHHGRIVKLMGDGALVEFGSVVDAVAYAVAVQKAVAVHQTQITPERRIVFRIGINLGDVVVEGEDLFGDGVNIAARLEQICPPGGVLISGTAFDQLQGKLNVPLEFAGNQHVKNIGRPITTYCVRLDGTARPSGGLVGLRQWRVAAAIVLLAGILAGGAWWFWSSVPGSGKPAVAVLPFDNLSRDEVTGRLADGITEDIITDLARFRDLDVIARNSTLPYKDKPVDVREVGQQLGARYVLEGSIQRDADRVRVTAQLIDATSNAHLWSERWDRPASAVFDVQTELAERVAGNLGRYSGVVLRIDESAARRKHPQDLTAYDLYLLGLEAKHRGTRDSLEEAVRLLTRATELDPTLARAWTGLAFAFNFKSGWLDDPTELRRAGLAAARQAVELDPLDAEAHAALGEALGMAGELVLAETEFDKALALNPNSADLLTLYANWASSFGKVDQGVAAVERAMRLDPNSPVWTFNIYGYAFFMAGRYEDAVRMRLRIPREVYKRGDYAFLAASYAALGREQEARTTVAQALAQYPNLSIENYVALNPGWSEPERQRLIETMRKAGFPACAKEADFKDRPNARRLPECVFG